LSINQNLDFSFIDFIITIKLIIEVISVKIGIYAGPEFTSFYGDKRYEKIKTLGFSYVDFSNSDVRKYPYNASLRDAEAFFKNERKMMEQADVIPSQMHGPWYSASNITQEERDELFGYFCQSLQFASYMECKYWVIHPVFAFGTKSLPENEEETRKINVEFAKRLVDVAKPLGVTICLENMPFPSFCISKPLEIYSIIKEVNDENYKMCFDTGHVNVFKDLDVAKCFYDVADEVAVLHVHDNCGDTDSHLFPTFGSIDWKSFYKALCNTGFDGVFSLETSPKNYANIDEFENSAGELYSIAKRITEFN